MVMQKQLKTNNEILDFPEERFVFPEDTAEDINAPEVPFVNVPQVEVVDHSTGCREDGTEIKMFLSALSEDDFKSSEESDGKNGANPCGQTAHNSSSTPDFESQDDTNEGIECNAGRNRSIIVSASAESEDVQAVQSQDDYALLGLSAVVSSEQSHDEIVDKMNGSTGMPTTEVESSIFSTPGTDLGGAKFSKDFVDRFEPSEIADHIICGSKTSETAAEAGAKEAIAFSDETRSFETNQEDDDFRNVYLNDVEVLSWFSFAVLHQELIIPGCQDTSAVTRSILERTENFNTLCRYVADTVNNVTLLLRPGVSFSESVISSFEESTVESDVNSLDSAYDQDQVDSMLVKQRPWLEPVILSESSSKLSPVVLAANCVSFFSLASKLSKISSPFGDENPFLTMIVESSLTNSDVTEDEKTTQDLLFDQLNGQENLLVKFVYDVKCSCDTEMRAIGNAASEDNANHGESNESRPASSDTVETDADSGKDQDKSRRFIVPESHPSPFEASVCEVPRIVAIVLSFLGDPVAVCRMKMVNRFCRSVVAENEHVLMQNAVRTGGIEMSLRPAFWLWIALQKCETANHRSKFNGCDDLRERTRQGEEGKWHHVIKRDVERSFGNMPPHKTGARFRTDSIVRALVTWGRNRLMVRGVKGGGEPLPTPDIGPKDTRKQKPRPSSPTCTSPPWEGNGDFAEERSVNSEVSETPTDTVSDWGGVSPKGSFAGSVNDTEHDSGREKQLSSSAMDISVEDLALSGNSLSPDAKIDLRNKLSFILHSMAAIHEDIGYCQGMDYVVAHLLRILQETIKWKAANNGLPSVISTASCIETPTTTQPEDYKAIYQEVDENHVVEETVLYVMDIFFTNYNLKHMYWPELRCLKTCCRVFERLIQIKLPVLADHFEHHDLNVGLFALGWFQTLFLYLPSMPTATVCHMWDIWLVERSFKIFFRVGTAILFLSQPILLNHDLEGMMTYLNTIPDATLLQPDILIPCALNIKVTNRMLQELEAEVMKHP